MLDTQPKMIYNQRMHIVEECPLSGFEPIEAYDDITINP